MTDQSRRLSYENSGYISGKMVNDLSPKKTMIVLVIVIGCFAVLWPKVFYPMLLGSANNHIKPSPIDRTQGCCDVISEKDLTTIKLMSEICSTIIQKDGQDTLSNKELISRCQNTVLETCGIDISAVLQEQVRLGHTTKQILQEIRSLNGSLCLKYNFGVATWKLGVPHRVTVKVSPSHSIKQERPLHLRSEMVHPAFRERGRAIPQPESFPPTKPAPPSRLIPKIVDGRPGPIPGMRPTLGGAGHVVPPSKHGGNSMGLIMPIYTIGIVVFFTYTVMKIVFKTQPEVLYPPVDPDPKFRREVFEADRGHLANRVCKDGSSSKLGWKERDAIVNAMSALLDEVDLELSSRRNASEVDQQDVLANGTILNQEEDQGSVQVMGMETTASCEGGKKWVRPASPVTYTPPPPEPVTPPQEIYLEGSLPPQSHLLVTDSATEAQKTEYENDPAVVLAGKMTLSVISLDSTENGTDDSSSSSKKHEDRSSSNVSEEFEKIDVAQLEEQINSLEIQPTLLERHILDDTTQESVNTENPENREELSQIHPTSFVQRELNIEYPVAKEELLILQSATLKQENLDHKPEVIHTTRDKRKTSLEPILDETIILEEEAERNNEGDILESINTESIDSTFLEPKNRRDIEQEEISITPTVIEESRSVETAPTVQSPALQEDNLDEIKEYMKIQEETSSHEDIQPLEAMSTTNVSNESSNDKNEDEANAEEVVPEVIEFLSDGDEEVDEEIEEEVEEEEDEEDEDVEDEEESEEEDDDIDGEQIAHV